MTRQASRPSSRRDRAAPATRPATRRGGLRRGLRWLAGGLGLVALAGAALLAWAVERPMAAPEWLRDRLETRVNAIWPDAELALGTVTFELGRTLDVAVGVGNLAVTSDEARPLINLTRLDATLSRRGLLRGRIEAKEVSAAGLFLTLERDAEGRFNLALGDGLAQTAPDFRSLLAQIDATIEHPQLAALRSVTLNALTLDYRDRMARRAWLVDGGRIVATRSAEEVAVRGDLAILSGGAEIATLAVTGTSPLGSRALSLGVTLDNMPAADIATQSPALAWLGLLEAPISGSLRADVDDAGRLGPLNATLQIGAGNLQPAPEAVPVPFEAARTYFTFDPAAARFDFSDITVESAWLTARGGGTALLEAQDDGRGLAGLTVQIRLSELSGNPGGLYADGPRRLAAVDADLRLRLDPFALQVGQATARMGDLQLRARMDARTDASGWQVSALVEAPRVEMPDLLALWPMRHAPRTRTWLERNLLSGAFDNLQMHIRARPGVPNALYLGAMIRDAQVQALQTFPPIAVARGRLTLEDRALSVVADAASVDPGRGGPIDVSGTTFHIVDTAVRPGAARVHLETEGSVEATLALLDNPPLEIMRKANRAVDLAEGRALLRTDLSFPLKARLGPDEIDFAGTGRIEDLRSTSIVPGRTMAADGLDVAVTRDALRLSGQGTLSDVPFDAQWVLPLSGPREARQADLRAEIALSDASLGAFGIGLPPGTIRGRGTGDLVVEFPPGAAPSFSFSSTLDGIGLSVPALGWDLSEAAQGRFTIAGALGPRPRIDRIALQAPRLEAEGRLSLAETGGLEAAVLDRLRVGGWLDSSVTLRPRGPGQVPAVSLGPGRLDLRTAPFGQSGAPRRVPAPGDAPLVLDGLSLQVTDTLRFDNLQGRLTNGQGLSGRFTARVNGGTPIEGRALVRDGRTGFDLSADDAGAVLRDAGLFGDMAGGELRLKLRPAPAPAIFDGELAIDRVRIRNAPAMAALLNAVSVVGLLDELTGQGIYFEEIDAAFRLGRGALTVTQSSAVGPSMGLSLDGYYDLAGRVVDFQGVVSPLYAVNILGRVIARRGEGLIGVSFTMQGPDRAPAITVNPLSVLTPGMFREIFRRPPPSLDQ